MRTRRLSALLAGWVLAAAVVGGSVPIANATGTGGGLAVTTLDPAGTTLVGTCFELWTDGGGGVAGKLVAGSLRCDQPMDPLRRPEGDGVIDGTTAWTGLAPGAYVLRETLSPALAGTAATYETAPDTALRIRDGEVTREVLVHRPTGGVVVRKTDAAGRPLPGACFAVVEVGARLPHSVAICDRDGPAITGLPPADGKADGLLIFTGLTPSLRPRTYRLEEVRAPDGYAPVADQQFIADPAVPLELTIANATGTGEATGAVRITELALEIESTITIQAFNGIAVTDGRTTASGRVFLTSDGGDTWQGRGTLESTTKSGTGACPSIHLDGRGTYDWVVRTATVSPDLPAERLVVNMDSGPAVEQPDAFVMDACSMSVDGTMNTWEHLFFDVHRADFLEAGFRVDGWTLTGPTAWQDGGVVAEATWSGTCQTKMLLECTESTAFRLVASVERLAATPAPTDGGGVVPESPSPGASEGAPTATVAAPTPADSAAPGGSAAGCGDDCGAPALLPIVLGGLVIVVLGGALVWWRLASTAALPLKVTPPDLSGQAGSDPAMEPLTLDPEIVDLDKTLTTDPEIVDLDKTLTTDPEIVDLDRTLTTDPEIVDLDRTLTTDPWHEGFAK